MCAFEYCRPNKLLSTLLAIARFICVSTLLLYCSYDEKFFQFLNIIFMNFRDIHAIILLLNSIKVKVAEEVMFSKAQNVNVQSDRISYILALHDMDVEECASYV